MCKSKQRDSSEIKYGLLVKYLQGSNWERFIEQAITDYLTQEPGECTGGIFVEFNAQEKEKYYAQIEKK